MTAPHWARWLRRRIREAIADNQWLLPSAGSLIGLILAMAVGTGGVDDSWTITVDRSRDTLMSALTLIFTALSIVLALASVAAENVVARFGSRVLRIYARRNADRWVIGAFTMTATFILVEQFQLRTLEPDAPAPVAGLTISVLLLVLTGALMIWYVATVIGWFRVDRAIRKLRDSTLIAVRAVERVRRENGTLTAMPSRTDRAVDLRATDSGYVAQIDHDTILRAIGETDCLVVFTDHLGEPVVQNQAIGWVDALDRTVEQGTSQALAEMIDISGTRELAEYIEYGIVSLVDIAIMALSPAVNDPNTAVEVIEAMSFLFPQIAEVPLGPYAVPDAESRPRVVVDSPTFGWYVDLATSQIVDYGITDRYVAQALRRFARSLALLDLDDDDQRHVDQFAAKLVAAPSS